MNPYIDEIKCSQTNHLLARIIHTESLDNPQTQFFTNNDEILQCGLISYPKSLDTSFHFHNPVKRLTYGTLETLFVIKGSAVLEVMSLETNKVYQHLIYKGDLINLLSGAHRIITNEDSPILMLEVKNGPYIDQKIDKQFINS